MISLEIQTAVPLNSHRYAHPHMRPLPLQDPEVAHLTEEGKVAALITKCHREYDWHDKVRDRRVRAEWVRRLRMLVTDEHPVVKEWAWLSKASNEEYARYRRNGRKVQLWEQKFRDAKSTFGRHQALMQLWKVVPESHPMVQLYLNRHDHKPESRKGWWELEAAPKAGRKRSGKTHAT